MYAVRSLEQFRKTDISKSDCPDPHHGLPCGVLLYPGAQISSRYSPLVVLRGLFACFPSASLPIKVRPSKPGLAQPPL